MANVVTANKITLLGDINGGSSTTDIFPAGTAAYSIYRTPELPEGWVECNGQTLSGSFADSDSPYNGQTIPDLNASSGTARFLRGAISSGTESGTETHNHQWLGTAGPNGGATWADSDQNSFTSNGSVHGTSFSGQSLYTNNTSTISSFYGVVWIMRIK